MEFEAAARRLTREHSGLSGRRGPPVISVKAKREAEFRKKQQERLRAERLRKKQQLEHVQHYMMSCNRALGVKYLNNSNDKIVDDTGGSIRLQATSIHGDGDKIALPPSVLQKLTENILDDSSSSPSSPWTFRVGVPRPNYVFPASLALLNMKVPSEDNMAIDLDVDVDVDNFSDYDEGSDGGKHKIAYLEELSHKYISYTHCTVVEFTQEEGNVGLPASIASALLDAKRRRLEDQETVTVAVTRTIDPAGKLTEEEALATEGEKTPGHLAWGAFDIPSAPVDITMLRLPKGKGCTLVPTTEAIRSGFYELKDVKIVLEQSLIRTRATLSVGDVVHTWHRGLKFDLIVQSVIPADYHAVSCINTDIEVDIASTAVEDSKHTMEKHEQPPVVTHQSSFAPGLGRVLSGEMPPSTEMKKGPLQPYLSASIELLPEPPLEQKEGICTIQIRTGGGKMFRRRFDVTCAKLKDLFSFAALVSSETYTTQLVLATRFPRKVFALNGENDCNSMEEVGIQAGQQQFFVELK